VKAIVLLSVSALSLFGPCSRRADETSAAAKPEVTFQLAVNVNQIAPPPDGLTVILDGKPIGDLAEKGARSAPFTLPADTMGVDLAPRLKARLQTSCGKEDFAVRPYYATREQEAEYRDKYSTTKDWLTFIVEGIEEATLYVDNVEGRAREMRVGVTTIDVPADSPLQTRVRIGRCPEGKSVTVGGSSVGELSMARRNAKAIPAALVDALGGNCYRRALKIYKEKGTPGFGAAPPPPEKLSGARVYAIDHPTDFLQASPKEFEKVFGPEEFALPMDSRVEINRCAGTPKRGGKVR
jgi:hypothetical protein